MKSGNVVVVLPRTPRGNGWSDWVEQSNGSRLRAQVVVDYDTSFRDVVQDCDEGEFDWSPHRGPRPPQFDGGAVVVSHDRNGRLWFQPNAKSLGEFQPQMVERVRSYYAERWHYVGVVVEGESPPCPHCGERKKDTQSVFGVESDYIDTPHGWYECVMDLAFSVATVMQLVAEDDVHVNFTATVQEEVV